MVWKRIISDYEDNKNIPSDLKKEVINLFLSKMNQGDKYYFDNKTFGDSVNAILDLIYATRKMFEENKNEEKIVELKSIHLQSIIMLENLLLINSKKISS